MPWQVFAPTARPGGYQCVVIASERDIRQAIVDGRIPPMWLVRRENGAMHLAGALPPPERSWWNFISKAALVVGGVYGLLKITEYATSTEEQRSIRKSARKHLRQGADSVAADHIGWEYVPPVTGRRRADVFAVYGERIVIEEHETERSVGRQHSRDQDRDLRRWARRNGAEYRQVVAGK